MFQEDFIIKPEETGILPMSKTPEENAVIKPVSQRPVTPLVQVPTVISTDRIRDTFKSNLNRLTELERRLKPPQQAT